MACQEGSNAQETSKAVLALGFLIVKKKKSDANLHEIHMRALLPLVSSCRKSICQEHVMLNIFSFLLQRFYRFNSKLPFSSTN